MSVRWAHVASKEWHQGKLVKDSPLIVGSQANDPVLHLDKDKTLAALVEEGLEKGTIQLPGRRTGLTGARAELPDKYLCLFSGIYGPRICARLDEQGMLGYT